MDHQYIIDISCIANANQAFWNFMLQDLQYAMRRAGQNPTDVEVQDLINKIDDGSGTLDFSDFCLVIKEKSRELESETHFKDTFRVFSKDEEGRKSRKTHNLVNYNSRLHPSRGDEVCVDAYAREGNLQGD